MSHARHAWAADLVKKVRRQAQQRNAYIAVLFDLTGPGGTRVMGLAGAPYLLMLGMNSHGIANVSNSVHSNDNRIGVPNVFVRRATLEARTLEEARDRGLLAARARGTNQFFADTGGRLWDLETSATAYALMDHSAAGFMAHANHYVSPDMLPYEGSTSAESPVRLATAERLLRDGVAAGEDPVELIARVLRTHEPSPDQRICGHPDPDAAPGDQGMTVGSMICDLDERRLYACAGPPCENPYEVFEMDDV
jgi:isopenicillin-N N-acyltransferase-like protein